jgi:hypothetical protein
MIYTFIAYAPKEHERDLAWTYNEFMRNLPNDDDWACFIDHDAMFTTPDWYPRIERIIRDNPQYSCYTAMTNRAYAMWQIPEGVNSINHDMRYHRDIGKRIQNVNNDKVVDVTMCGDLPAPPPSSPFSGVVILYKKSAWKDVPFRLMQPNRLTGIDNLLHLDLRNKGHKVGLMTGIYVYHWHRADGKDYADLPEQVIKQEIPERQIPKQVKYLPEGFEWAQDTATLPEETGMDIEMARDKISRCNGGDFVIIGAPIPNDRAIDVCTCLWIEHKKRLSNMMALYECSRFASHGRNNVCYKTLEYLPGATHVFFIDKDVLPPVDAIERLLAHDKDIVVGATPIFKDQPVWSVMKYDPNETIDNIFTPIPYADLPKKLFRAHHFGGTTVLIKRHVLEKMQYPWYQDVFAPGAILLGQDLFFTAKAKQMGFELWCDPTVQCEHLRQSAMKTVFDKCLEMQNKELISGKVNN